MNTKEEFLKEHNEQVLENRRAEKWDKFEKVVMRVGVGIASGLVAVIIIQYFHIL